MENALPVVKREKVADRDGELLRLTKAEETCAREIELMAEETEVKAGRQVAAIVRSHVALLGDPELNGGMRRMIREDGFCCEWAVEAVLSRYRHEFEMMEDELMRQRGADLEDIRIRLLHALSGSTSRDLSLLPEGSVIAAKELTPSMTASMDAGKVAAILTEEGGIHSHTAILARALEIPAVTGIEGLMDHVQTGMDMIVDGFSGRVIVNPDAGILGEYAGRREAYLNKKKSLLEYANRRAVTADGREITLKINMDRPGDVVSLNRLGAAGVGLLRTEFLFMSREQAPDEEEQFRIYSSVVRNMGGRPLTIRTLDIGGDKNVPCVRVPKEDNPFLGYRGIRLCLDRREELFLPQVRAILRAGAMGNVKIMLPMVACLEELREGRRLIEEARRSLRARGIPCGEHVPVGMMAETPASVLLADRFAAEADFFSIGTNDLIQYTMAVDRGNNMVSHIYSPFHPAVLRSVCRIVQAGRQAGIPVGICGEAAADPGFLVFLLGIGIGEMSMAPPRILKAKETLGRVDMKTAEETAKRMLLCLTEGEAAALARAAAGCGEGAGGE